MSDNKMMENVKVALLGVILLISAYGVYQIAAVRSDLETLKTDLTAKMTMSNLSGNIDNSAAAVPPMNPNELNSLPSTPAAPVGPTTSISFTEELHDFGTVQVESENLYAFVFKNTGSEPLIISDAKGSCGCTVPNWPKEPIMPGQTGKIDVKFTPNAGQAGQPVEKVVTVTANTSPENTMVRIKANVIAK